MAEFFHKKRIRTIAEAAEKYAAANYVCPSPSVPAEKEAENSSAGGVKFSSRGDYYNTDEIKKNVSSFILGRASHSSVLDSLEESTNMTFVDKLLEYINLSGERDSKIYSAANVDRRLYSKIISDRFYKPSKDTCIAFAFALELPPDQAKDLIERAGYTLSHSSKRDVILEYFFKERIYNIIDINEILITLNEKPLGR